MFKKTAKLLLAACTLLALHSYAALSSEFSTTLVLGIETTYVPSKIVFRVNYTRNAQCPSGRLIYVNSNPENVKAAQNILTSAYLAGKPIYAVYDTATIASQGAGLCAISFIGVGTP